jgi:hypothetical protein
MCGREARVIEWEKRGDEEKCHPRHCFICISHKKPANKKFIAHNCTYEHLAILPVQQHTADQGLSSHGGRGDALHALRTDTRGAYSRRDTSRRHGTGAEYRQWQSRREEQEHCWRCGGSQNSEECVMKTRDCFSCGDQGHVARMC